MSNWQSIWNNKIADKEKVLSVDVEECFMELKHLTGNDILNNGGVPYKKFSETICAFKRKAIEI